MNTIGNAQCFFYPQIQITFSHLAALNSAIADLGIVFVPRIEYLLSRGNDGIVKVLKGN